MQKKIQSELYWSKAFKLSYASVILGMLSGVFLIFSAIPAIICAILALSDFSSYPSEISKTGKRIAIFGLLWGLLGLFLSIISAIKNFEIFY